MVKTTWYDIGSDCVRRSTMNRGRVEFHIFGMRIVLYWERT